MGDYNKYVFNSASQLVGKFDEMYRNCPDPWHQSEREKMMEIDFLKANLSSKHYKKGLDLGCGLGYISNIISQCCDNLDACDISQTAINKAADQYKHINFFVHDLLWKEFPYDKKYDLIVLSGTLWYVVKEIDFIFDKIKNLLSEDGEFVLTLPFPNTTKFFYGKNIISNEVDLLKKFKKYFQDNVFIVIKNNDTLDWPTVQIKGTKYGK